MSAICIIDTSVYCNLLDIPNRNQDRKETVKVFGEYNSAKYTFLLPMTAIYETGNHIAQNGDGNVRRAKAILFKEQLIKAFKGQAPWTVTPIASRHEIVGWLDKFPDWAMQKAGFGDLAIHEVWKQQCQLHQARRVFIWTYDEDLKGYDRVP